MKIILRSAVVAAAFLLFAACQGTSHAASTGQAAMNTKCPMTGEDLEAASPTTYFHGKKVAFCCPKCIPGWNKLSDADKQAKLDKAK